MNKEHPILFSTPMVQAILEGRKTQTRRIIKPQPIDNIEVDGNFFEGNHKGYVKVDNHPNWQKQFVYEFSNKQIGDILWVREAFELYTCNCGGDDYTILNRIADNSSLEYNTNMRSGKHPSLHFPKQAARIFLEITNIRVERLQDISEEEAEKEGVEQLPFDGSYKQPFERLWNKINGNWDQNPFVWVIEFKNKKFEK